MCVIVQLSGFLGWKPAYMARARDVQAVECGDFPAELLDFMLQKKLVGLAIKGNPISLSSELLNQRYSHIACVRVHLCLTTCVLVCKSMVLTGLFRNIGDVTRLKRSFPRSDFSGLQCVEVSTALTKGLFRAKPPSHKLQDFVHECFGKRECCSMPLLPDSAPCPCLPLPGTTPPT